MSENALEHLEELRKDDYIWYIYIFIVVFALYSNYLERDYVYTKNKRELEAYHSINIVLFTIAFFIYLYFLNVNARHYDKKKNFNNFLSLAGTSLLLASGALILIAEIRNSSEDAGFGI